MVTFLPPRSFDVVLVVLLLPPLLPHAAKLATRPTATSVLILRILMNPPRFVKGATLSLRVLDFTRRHGRVHGAFMGRHKRTRRDLDRGSQTVTDRIGGRDAGI